MDSINENSIIVEYVSPNGRFAEIEMLLANVHVRLG